MNKSAVALAADSAVTVGEGDSGKVYNTVNKLFTLSKFHPVGVMIYANAEYMGIPFETVVKAYRRKLGRSREPTIDAYARGFTRYLASPLFTSANQQAANVVRTWQVVFNEIRRDIASRLGDESRSKGHYSLRRRIEIITGITNERFALLDGASFFPGFARKNLRPGLRRYRSQYDAVLDSLRLKAPSNEVARAWRAIAG